MAFEKVSLSKKEKLARSSNYLEKDFLSSIFILISKLLAKNMLDVIDDIFKGRLDWLSKKYHCQIEKERLTRSNNHLEKDFLSSIFILISKFLTKNMLLYTIFLRLG